jgi:hypothetical protein
MCSTLLPAPAFLAPRTKKPATNLLNLPTHEHSCKLRCPQQQQQQPTCIRLTQPKAYHSGTLVPAHRLTLLHMLHMRLLRVLASAAEP